MMTHRQKQTYDFIRKFWAAHGYGPTYREIAQAIGVSGPGRAFSVVAALEERNWIRIGYRDNGTAANRAIIPLIPRTDLNIPGRERTSPLSAPMGRAVPQPPPGPFLSVESPMAIRHLDQFELADRWNISERTLAKWRLTGGGPVYLKIGGRVVYRLEDIEHHEAENLRASTSDAAG